MMTAGDTHMRMVTPSAIDNDDAIEPRHAAV
jgi:hypothetical protein